MSGLVPDIYAGIFVTYPVAVMALALRFTARRMTKMRLWYDDYLAVAAVVFSTGYSIDLLVATNKYMLGQTIGHLDNQRTEYILTKTRLCLWISSLLYASSIASAKLAILTFYWRIFQFSSIRYPILILLVAATLWYIIRTFMVIFMCSPVSFYWDKSIPNGHCRINVSNFFFGSVLTHSILDLIILVLPSLEVVRLHLPLGQKIATVGLFTSGALVCVASVFILIESVNYDPTTRELPYALTRNVLWAAVEINLAIFSSCLPILRPIFRKLFPGIISSGVSRPITLPTVVIPDPDSSSPSKDSPNTPSSRGRWSSRGRKSSNGEPSQADESTQV